MVILRDCRILNDSQNTISQQKLLTENNDEVLSEDKEKQFNNNYEKTLTKFLSDIYNKKEEIKNTNLKFKQKDQIKTSRTTQMN